MYIHIHTCTLFQHISKQWCSKHEEKKLSVFGSKPSFGFKAIMMYRPLILPTFSPTLPKSLNSNTSSLCHTHAFPPLCLDPSTSRFPIIYSIFTFGSWLKCYSISFVSLLSNSKMQASPNSSCSPLLTILPFLKLFLLNYNYITLLFPFSPSNPSHITPLVLFKIHDHFFHLLLSHTYVYGKTYIFLNTEIQPA